MASFGEGGHFSLLAAQLAWTREDAWGARRVRLIWTCGAPTLALEPLRARWKEQRLRERQAGVLFLQFDEEAEAARQHALASAERALALKREAEAPRRDQYVKGAMEWERTAWKVWDKKKEAEEKRRDRYGRALTHYIGGSKIVVREEPPALTQCAHCDLGGGIHPLRRCMGCFAVAYCCKLHQKVHWQWHKHICFAIRAANNLEARKGEGAGWVKLRPRRWRRPPIEKGAVVETNCRMRWANWKQFYTNGAMPMLNMMGDGGPLVCKAWDEAIASMAMCEEATFVFGVKEVQRMMMPFVAARRAPPGTILVIEVGLIDVRRDNGRRREVDDYLWFKTKAEHRQMKLDRIEEQKLMRIRERRERDQRTDTVQRLLKASTEQRDAELDRQKDGEEAPTGPPTRTADAVPAVAAATVVEDEREVWEEAPDMDYEAFEEVFDTLASSPFATDDVSDTAAFEGSAHVPLETEVSPPPPAWMPPSEAPSESLTTIPRDALDPQRPSQPREYIAPFVASIDSADNVGGEPAYSASVVGASADDGWGDIDTFSSVDPRALQKSIASPAPPPTTPLGSAPQKPEEKPSMHQVLDEIGLSALWDAFERAGLTDAQDLAHMGSEAGTKLASLGLKLGQRQRLLNVIAKGNGLAKS